MCINRRRVKQVTSHKKHEQSTLNHTKTMALYSLLMPPMCVSTVCCCAALTALISLDSAATAAARASSPFRSDTSCCRVSASASCVCRKRSPWFARSALCSLSLRSASAAAVDAAALSSWLSSPARCNPALNCVMKASTRPLAPASSPERKWLHSV